MSVGVCSCTAGQAGSPCSHQAAVVRHYGVPSINCIPTLSPQIRQELEIATIALGSNAVQKHQFYASLHQEKQESKVLVPSHDNQDFSGTACDLVRSMVLDVDEPIEEGNSSEPNIIDDIPEITSKIDEFAADIKSRMQDTTLIAQAMKMKTFLRRYSSLTQPGTSVNA